MMVPRQREKSVQHKNPCFGPAVSGLFIEASGLEVANPIALTYLAVQLCKFWGGGGSPKTFRKAGGTGDEIVQLSASVLT